MYLKSKIYKHAPRIILRPTLFFIDKFFRTVFRSQSNESEIITKIVAGKKVFFIEFGFGATEFNFAVLSKSGEVGILIDASEYNCTLGKKILHRNTKVFSQKLSPEDLIKFKSYIPETRELIMSIDVDGNDYEFFKFAILNLKPYLIICEYNSSFGEKRIKVPYDPNFDRYTLHKWWHGVSLNSLVDLAHANNYCLVATSSNSVNAFFIQSGDPLAKFCKKILAKGHQDNNMGERSMRSSLTNIQQFEIIKDYPYTDLENERLPCPNNN
jgi:hypothetical protein